MVFPLTVLPTHVEIYVGGAWVDITSDVLGEGAGPSIDTHRGRDDGLSNVQYGTAAMELKNTLGKYSPRNPNSIYYGLLGKNTPIRIYITPHWTSGAGMDDVDTFTRNTVDGWDSTDGGNAYELYGFGGSVLTSDWQVNGAYGIHYVPAAPGYRQSDITALNLLDVDVYATVDTYVSGVGGGNLELGGIFLRYNADGTGYFARLNIDPSEVMTASLYFGDSVLLAQATVSTFVWAGQAVRIRARIIGNEFSYKVWDASTSEPAAWSVTVEDTQSSIPGSVAFRSGRATGNTNVSPVEFRWDSISITNICTRFAGEVAEWPATQDSTGTDIRTKLNAFGIMCRYNQGLKTPRSALERLIRSYNPVMYLPLTDGTDTAVGDGSTISGGVGYYSDVTTAPIKLACVEGPIGARQALPELASSAATYEPIITVTNIDDTTASWEINFIAKIDRDAAAIGVDYRFTWQTEHMTWMYEIFWDNTPQYYIIVTGSASNGSGANVFIMETYTAVDGNWHHHGVRVTPSGSNINTYVLVDGTTLYSAIGSAGSAGSITSVTVWGHPTTEASSVSVGHVALYAVAPTYSTYPAMGGHFNEAITARIDRLVTQDNISIALRDDGTSPLLAAQRQAKLIELLQDIQAADLGVMYESRGSRTLTYRALNNLYNQVPISLGAYSNSVLATVPEILDDDATLWNDVTVERYNAAQYRAELTTGSLGTALPPDGAGTYDRGKFTSHVSSDTDLPDIAYWLLSLGTLDEPRFDGITINLARSQLASNHALSAQIALLDIGDVLRITDMPVMLPPEAINAMVQGYTEHLSNLEWTITFTTTPASPYTVGVYDGATSRYHPSDSSIDTAIDSDDVTLSVAFTGTRWVRTADDAGSLPFDIMIGGERMTVTAVTGTTTPQSFTVTRSVNGIVKSHVSGSSVDLFEITRYAL